MLILACAREQLISLRVQFHAIELNKKVTAASWGWPYTHSFFIPASEAYLVAQEIKFSSLLLNSSSKTNLLKQWSNSKQFI